MTRPARGVTGLINEPAEEQAAQQLKGRTLDAWSWIARAREAAAKAVAPSPQAADGTDGTDGRAGEPRPASPDRDLPAD